MAAENAKVDNNYHKSLLAVTDDGSAELKRLLVDPVTGRLKVSAVVSGAMNAATVTVADTTDASSFVALFESATGDLEPKTDGALLYNASTGALTATSFVGNLTGNASGTSATVTGAAQTAITSAANLPWTGLATGTDGEIPTFDASGNPAFVATGTSGQLLVSNGAGTAPTFQTVAAGTPTNITVADTADATCFVALFESATGDLAPKTDLGLTYAADTGTLTATAFSGPLTGNVTGNASGTAATVTTAAQPNITSLGTLTTLTVDDITINGNTISSAGASTLAITPTAGQAITFDGTVTLDAGVIAGATSITSTTFIGNLTGNASGTAATVTGAAQASITSATNLPWTGLKVGTDGEIPTFDASGNPAFVAVGTATHVLTSNGAGAAPTFQAVAAAVPLISVTALESGNARDLMTVNLISTTAAATGDKDFGKVTTSKKAAFSVIGNGATMTTMKCNLGKTGSPTDNITIRIETDNAGAPSGTLADADATASVVGSGLTTTNSDTTITFAGDVVLTNGVKYWVVFYRDGAESDANYYQFGMVITTPPFCLCTWSVFGASWSAEAQTNVYYTGGGFLMAGARRNTGTSLNVGPRFLGFASANYTAGSTMSITTEGQIATGFSSLELGYNYTASATPGAITLGAMSGTTNIVGVAISSTELLVTYKLT